MAGAFYLFKGVTKKQDRLKHWTKKIGSLVRIPQITSCSQSLKVALNLAIPDEPKPGYSSVLFVIICHNYYSPKGIRLNNGAYTPFPAEREMLLMEGVAVWVLEVEESIYIDNDHDSFTKFNGSTLTIVHLYHNQ